jgi:hypothetical protein
LDNRIDVATIIVAVCVAAYAAIMLAYVAQTEFDLPATQLRHLSMIAALFIAFPVALDFLRPRPDKAG